VNGHGEIERGACIRIILRPQTAPVSLDSHRKDYRRRARPEPRRFFRTGDLWNNNGRGHNNVFARQDDRGFLRMLNYYESVDRLDAAARFVSRS